MDLRRYRTVPPHEVVLALETPAIRAHNRLQPGVNEASVRRQCRHTAAQNGPAPS